MFKCLNLFRSDFLPLVNHLVLDGDFGIALGSLHHGLETFRFGQQGLLLAFRFCFQFHLDGLGFRLCFGQDSFRFCICLTFYLLGQCVRIQDGLLFGYFGRNNLIRFQGLFHFAGFRFFYFTLCVFLCGEDGSLCPGLCFTGFSRGFRLGNFQFRIAFGNLFGSVILPDGRFLLCFRLLYFHIGLELCRTAFLFGTRLFLVHLHRGAGFGDT